MNKKTLGILAAVSMIFAASLAFALEPTYSSGKHTTDGIAYGHACYLVKLIGRTDGTNDLTLVVHNSTDDSGPIVGEFVIKAIGDGWGGLPFYDLVMANGVYIDMTTSGTGSWWVEYKR